MRYITQLPWDLINYKILTHLISSWWRSAHISSHPGRITLRKMPWTSVSHSSQTTFRAVLTMNSSSGVAPMEVSWSQISCNLRRYRSIWSHFYIWYDCSWFSNSIFHCTEVPWYNVVKVSHMSFVVFFSEICGMTWSLTPTRIMQISFVIRTLSVGSTGIDAVLKAKPLMQCLSRTYRILAFQMTNLEAPSNLSWYLSLFIVIFTPLMESLWVSTCLFEVLS